MKHTLFLICALLLIPTSPSIAASQDECAIWLCLPAGFPSGCGGAKSAFKNRIKHHKPPLPAFSSCATNSSGMSFRQGRAVKNMTNSCSGLAALSGSCQSQPVGTWEKDGTCKSMYCETKQYIDIFENGQSIGSTYYY